MTRFLGLIIELVRTIVCVLSLAIVFFVLFFMILFFIVTDKTKPENFYKENHKVLNNLVYQIENHPNNIKQVLDQFDWNAFKCSKEKKKDLKKLVHVKDENRIITVEIVVANYMFDGYGVLLYKSDNSLPTRDELEGSKESGYKRVGEKWFAIRFAIIND